MAPMREGGGEAYFRTKPYCLWVGESLAQVTWESTAKKFGAEKPGDCLSWSVAFRAAFEGMTKGMFTGEKLSDYISDGKLNFVGARRIVNGADRAPLIAGYAKAFQAALTQARELTTPGARSSALSSESRWKVSICRLVRVTPPKASEYWRGVGASSSAVSLPRSAPT